jgi:membrane AbrB-like protein
MTRGRPWILLGVLSLALSLGMALLAIPAPFLLAPALVGIAFGCLGVTLRVPRPAFTGAQAIVGTVIARGMTGAIVADVASQWALMLAIVATTLLAAALVGWLLARFGRLDPATAAWGSSPGAASAVIAAAGDFGADPRIVGFMQYLRMIMVVLAASTVTRTMLGMSGAHPVAASDPAFPAPLALLATLALAFASAWVAGRLRIPAGALLAPMVVGTVLNASGIVHLVLTPWLIAGAYTVIGWYVGLGFTRATLRYVVHALPELIAGTLLLIGVCAFSAWIWRGALHTDALTAYLATSPGSIDSVTIIALGSGANVPLVVAVGSLRMLLVILTGPLIARAIVRLTQTTLAPEVYGE